MNFFKSQRIALIALSAVIFSCAEEIVRPTQQSKGTQTEAGSTEARYGKDDNLLMGNPSNASNNSYFYWNYLIKKNQYAMSYHRDRGTPNWVSWHLNEDWLGSSARSNNFTIDSSIPSDWYHVNTGDYTNSGFDRGHNCPSADRTLNTTDNKNTFLMTNIIPQAPNNNQRVWASLESYCRKLVAQGNELYIIMGSYGTGGTGRNGYATTLAEGKITVPSNIWKVILVLPEGTNDLSRVNSTTRIIAVDIPNNQNISTNWPDYRTTVDNIEALRGYDLFSNVSVSIQKLIESRMDNGPTN